MVQINEALRPDIQYSPTHLQGKESPDQCQEVLARAQQGRLNPCDKYHEKSQFRQAPAPQRLSFRSPLFASR